MYYSVTEQFIDKEESSWWNHPTNYWQQFNFFLVAAWNWLEIKGGKYLNQSFNQVEHVKNGVTS